MKATVNLIKSTLGALIISLCVSTTGAADDYYENDALLSGNCPVLSSIRFHRKEALGIWYNTHTTYPQNSTCVRSLLVPMKDGIAVFKRENRRNGDVYHAKGYYKFTRIPGIFEFYINIKNRINIPIEAAMTIGDRSSALLWGCAELPGPHHFEFALIYSRTPYIPAKRVRKYTEFLSQQGSALKILNPIASKYCD